MKRSDTAVASAGIDRAHRRVIFAASLGTAFEWYDFYLYGALSTIISRQFFSGVNETTGFIFALLAFAAGFFVRPFGALVFGRLGDMVGRVKIYNLGERSVSVHDLAGLADEPGGSRLHFLHKLDGTLVQRFLERAAAA